MAFGERREQAEIDVHGLIGLGFRAAGDMRQDSAQRRGNQRRRHGRAAQVGDGEAAGHQPDGGAFHIALLEIDVETGRTKGTLITRSNSLHAWCGLTPTPNGDALIMALDPGDRLAMVSTRTGRVIRTIQRGDFASWRTSRWQQIAGFDKQGRTAYVVMLDEAEVKTELIAWDLRTGESKLLFSGDAEIAGLSDTPNANFLSAKRIYVIPGSDPVQFLELPNLFGPMQMTTEVFVRALDEPKRLIATIESGLWRRSVPAFTADGTRVCLNTRQPGTISPAMFDVDTGARLSGWLGGAFDFPGIFNCADPPRSRMFVEGRWRDPLQAGNRSGSVLSISELQRGFLIGDLATTRWIAGCALPSEFQASPIVGPCVSPDGRFLAACTSPMNVASVRFDLLIYDLRSIDN